MSGGRRGPRYGAVALLLAVSACSAGTPGRHVGSSPLGSSPVPTGPVPTGPVDTGSGAGAGPACPGSYGAPAPDRPRLALRLSVSADHGTVTGHEKVTFTPDRAVTELVFRLVPNSPTYSVASESVLTVSRVTADRALGTMRFDRAGAVAGSPGGLLHVPLSAPLPAGRSVTADLDFGLRLGAALPGSFPRLGHRDGFAWLGSGFPLLAWQQGYGWHTEPLAQFPSESATSEAMALDLTVVTPRADVVLASGNPGVTATTGATRTWHTTLPAARDVAVATGPFVDTTTTVATGDGLVVLHLGAPTAAVRDKLLPEYGRAVQELSRRFGPSPFPSLSVARVPAEGGGIEYPGAILALDDSRLVAVHETAHQWFYGMVGDSQALHPWLDEAFAVYAEEQVDQRSPHPADLASPHPVDASLASYGKDEMTYYDTTYAKGSAALEAARSAAGGTAFDAALRCYVAANAWRVATPADVAAALAGLPKAVAVLRRAGALS